MDPLTDGPVTRLLAQWRAGDRAALAELTTLIYKELRRLAQRHLRHERSGHTIQSTALVHEAFMRLIDQQSVDWRGRAHFLALASQTMRRILVDHARSRLASKRGGGAIVVSFDELGTDRESPDSGAGESTPVFEPHQPDAHEHEDLAAIDAALTRLAALDSRQAQIVEMRYFGGLTIEQAAEAMSLSAATVKREWTLARAWLRRELSRSD